MKLLYNGTVFEWYAVKVKTESLDIYGMHTKYQQELVRIMKPIFLYRTNSQHRNLVRMKALRQAKAHTHFCTCTIDDWE